MAGCNNAFESIRSGIQVPRNIIIRRSCLANPRVLAPLKEVSCGEQTRRLGEIFGFPIYGGPQLAATNGLVSIDGRLIAVDAVWIPDDHVPRMMFCICWQPWVFARKVDVLGILELLVITRVLRRPASRGCLENVGQRLHVNFENMREITLLRAYPVS